MINLDKIAAERAQAIVSGAPKVDVMERLVTKALGVLQEQGVYALVIFLFSRNTDEADAGKIICWNLYLTLAALPIYDGIDDLKTLIESKPVAKTGLEFFSTHVLNDLDQLLLVRDLFEQTLTYARYNAKAIGS
jgi:hypothetical protein